MAIEDRVKYGDFNIKFCDDCEIAKKLKELALNGSWSAFDCAIDYNNYCYDCFCSREECQKKYLELEDAKCSGK